ncbi:MAG: urea carboxylase-associated family protein [Caulobacterales bacterium]
MLREIPPRSAVGFTLSKGQSLKIIDPQGQQVADLLAFNAADTGEAISSGRTLDYLSRFLISKGDPIYSNRSNVLFEVVEDTVGRHDFLLSPCSAEMFRILYGDKHPHRGCFGNLAAALEPYGIKPDQIPVALNVFMNVQVDGASGAISVESPLSKAGDYMIIKARMDLIIGLTACSAGQSNNFSYKPIHYEVMI